jgi:hypothetical protein
LELVRLHHIKRKHYEKSLLRQKEINAKAHMPQESGPTPISTTSNNTIATVYLIRIPPTQQLAKVINSRIL